MMSALSRHRRTSDICIRAFHRAGGSHDFHRQQNEHLPRLAVAPSRLRYNVEFGHHGEPSSTNGSGTPRGLLPFALAAAAGGLSAQILCEEEIGEGSDDGTGEAVTNWSGTHSVVARVMHRPETLQELEEIVSNAHQTGQKIRPMGSGISPNGIALCESGMVNLGLMDRVLKVDGETGRVTVQAGARVEQVVEALRPYGLTLQNYASVREQQIGGFIQVGAHGTGASLPPVDEQVLSLTLVTPAQGTLYLSPDKNPELFYLARCGLGSLGVVAEVTLQAVPAYLLFEEAFVTDIDTIRRNHWDWLKKYKHIRYMWIPYTKSIVVVRSNPLPSPPKTTKTLQPLIKSSSDSMKPGGAGAESRSALHSLLCPLSLSCKRKMGEEESERAMEPARQLYRASSSQQHLPSTGTGTVPGTATVPGAATVTSTGTVPNPEVETQEPDLRAGVWAGGGSAEGAPKEYLTESQLRALSFTELRDELLALDPLSAGHVRRVNRVEEEYWKGTQGCRVDWSDQILGFDCGGQQWVSEVCFPVPKPDGNPKAHDLDYVEEILYLIEKEGIPAPAPIEQRWTCGSRSPMSPASEQEATQKDSNYQNELFSWVGIIMYLPSPDPSQRKAITDRFMEYKVATARLLWDKHDAHEHWAKIEILKDGEDLAWLKDRLRRRFPTKSFTQQCRELDPNGVLSNDIIEALAMQK